MTAPDPDLYDVVIVGGGAAGLTLALQLKKDRPDTSVLLVERQAHPVPEAAHKVGESSVEIAAHYLRDVLGLEEHLKEQQLNKFGLRMFFSNNGNEDITHRVELGHAVCPPHGVGTYQLDRGRLENALGVEVLKAGVEFLPGQKVRAVELRPEQERHSVRFGSEDGTEREVHARWVVDGTGRSSLLKRQLGLAKKVEHRANAAWFRIAHPIDIDDWSSDPEWRGRIKEGRRELSTNHLMGPGYWVWLIRLASDAISIGIVTEAGAHAFEEMNRFERALDWLRRHEPQCAAAVEQHRDKVQDFKVMKDYAYSSEQVFSEDRWCLAGEAGVFLDPLYSPGLDLIAISNGLITDLIGHALDGEDVEDVEERAAIHNQMFLIIAEGWLRIYEQQYPLMSSAKITVAKVIWDTAVYWAVPGLLYFTDKIRRLIDFPQVVTNLARFTGTSEAIQRFFREWYAIEPTSDSDAFVSFYDFGFMPPLHLGMTAQLSDDELTEQFDANVRLVEQLSGQLVATVMADLADSQDEPVLRQLAAWRQDETLMGLVAIHEHDSVDNPLSDEWITLKRRARAQLESA